MAKVPLKEEHLPEVVSDRVTIPNPIPLTVDATEQDAIEADLPMANAVLHAVHYGWGEVKSIGGIEALIKMTIEATKHRRAVLGLPYGTGTKSESKPFVVQPLD